MNSKQSSSSKANEELPLQLPVTRVKTIMKSSPHVEGISQECLYLVTKATEMFIKHWAEQTYSKFNKPKLLEYKHLAEFAQTSSNFEFLREVVPRKITYKQFKEMMAAKKPESDSNPVDDNIVEIISSNQSTTTTTSNKTENKVIEKIPSATSASTNSVTSSSSSSSSDNSTSSSSSSTTSSSSSTTTSSSSSSSSDSDSD